MNKRETGFSYEKKAGEYLLSQGYEILEQNFYTRFGEIDLIAKDEDTIVFVEVKYRKSQKKGLPQEAVTMTKRRRIIKAAEYYLYRKRAYDCACRFDVVAIMGEELTHIKNAFDGDGRNG